MLQIVWRRSVSAHRNFSMLFVNKSKKDARRFSRKKTLTDRPKRNKPRNTNHTRLLHPLSHALPHAALHPLPLTLTHAHSLSVATFHRVAVSWSLCSTAESAGGAGGTRRDSDRATKLQHSTAQIRDLGEETPEPHLRNLLQNSRENCNPCTRPHDDSTFSTLEYLAWCRLQYRAEGGQHRAQAAERLSRRKNAQKAPDQGCQLGQQQCHSLGGVPKPIQLKIVKTRGFCHARWRVTHARPWSTSQARRSTRGISPTQPAPNPLSPASEQALRHILSKVSKLRRTHLQLAHQQIST